MDLQRLTSAIVRGSAAALLGGVLSAALTRALMRAISLTVGGDPEFSWSGTAIIAFFYVTFLTPGAVAVAYSRARWTLLPFAGGLLLLLEQAVAIGLSDVGALGPLSAGRRALLMVLLVAMAGVYALYATVVYRVARGGVSTRPADRAARAVD